MRNRATGFTLIELLIVVAIIAILAAIAVPNFLEAQTRAKVTHTIASMRDINVALESYKIDHNQIPMTAWPGKADFFPTYLMASVSTIGNTPYPGKLLTTPIAYITSIPYDVFNSLALGTTSWTGYARDYQIAVVVSWAPMGLSRYPGRDGWVQGKRKNGQSFMDYFHTKDLYAMMESTGPDLAWWDFLGNGNQQDVNPFFYDPTNGTVSPGQIVYLDTAGLISPYR